MKKRIIRICFLLAVLMAFAGISVSAEGQNTVTIKGDGVTKEMTWTVTELRAMTEGTITAEYSAKNNWPNSKTSYVKGVSLAYLLKQTGVKKNASMIKVISSDGYYKTFTWDQLMKADKYSFLASGTVPAETVLAYQRSEKSLQDLTDCEPVLTMGQHEPNEQTYPWFVQYVSEIEVTTEAPDQWAAPTFSKKVTKDGVEVTPVVEYINSVKIYYTTDGTEPTQNSNLYNLSATYYQPELNKPILVTENTEIRAFAVGPGKTASEVSSTYISFTDGSFLDLDGYEWARAAIEDLAAQKVVNGMSVGRYAPGESLTRVQFAKMVVLALGYEPAVAPTRSFSDVKAGDWFAPYVWKAAELGLINGYTNGTFRPNQALSKQEMIKIAACAAGTEAEIEKADLSGLDDKAALAGWAKKYVAFAESKGMLEHGHVALVQNGKLNVNGNSGANRAEAASVMFLMQKTLQ